MISNIRGLLTGINMVEEADQGVEPTIRRGVVETVEEVTVATTKKRVNTGELRSSRRGHTPTHGSKD